MFLRGGGTSANFLTFPTFSNRFTPMWLKMTHNGKFCQKSGLDRVKMANFACFSIFSPKMRLIDLEWSISPDSQLFPSFATKASHFWINPKNFHFWGACTLANFLSFPTFLNRFTPIWLKITHNCKFCQKSGLDWVKMANFACFSIFSPKMRLIDSEWSISPDSQLFPSFATKASHFWRNLKIFCFGGGVHRQIF